MMKRTDDADPIARAVESFERARLTLRMRPYGYDAIVIARMARALEPTARKSGVDGALCPVTASTPQAFGSRHRIR